ncbi:PREDICTED: transmembrane protein 88B [Chrysochloris asiatica]|uniref:Transmembrane protein 88B n=1 Tax=Chrysochloris asiatica TaxID=185453 RepID=A0A9B0WVP6_CHRAS|nr:PREDICTED: transmembrane protein 88B [Chrysochloris asiatica]
MSQQERETEEDEGGGGSDMTPMLPRRLSDHQTSPGWAGLATRGLGTLLLPSRTLAGLLLHLLLPAMVFLLMLLPAAAIVYLGFLCHSRVHPAPRPPCRAMLSDRGSATLIVFGFLSLPPLLVLASAAQARLARRLHPLLQPPSWTHGPHHHPESRSGELMDHGLDEAGQFCY